MITLNDTGVWTIYIDDVDGELAMDQNERAAAKIEVVELEVFEKLLKERDKWKNLASPFLEECNKAGILT